MNRQTYPILENQLHETDVYVADAPEDGPTILVFGGVHGNEVSGSVAAGLIRCWSITRGKLVVVPEAARLACKHRRRNYPIEVDRDPLDANVRAADLNRQFFSPSGPIAPALWELVDEHDPDYVFDLHRSAGLSGGRSPSGVGQCIFTARKGTSAARNSLSHLNSDHVSQSSHRFVVSTNMSKPTLIRRVNERTSGTGWLVETTSHEQGMTTRIDQLEHAVEAILYHSTGGNVRVSDYGHEDQEPLPEILDEYHPTEPPVSELRVAVTDENGDPIEGAHVRGSGDPHASGIATEFGSNGYTDSEGVYSNEIYENRYKVSISADGYQAETRTVELDGDTSVDVTLSAARPPASVIEVAVHSPDGIPVEGASIEGQGEEHPADVPLVFRGETDSRGILSKSIFDNRYTITATHPLYEPTTVSGHDHSEGSSLTLSFDEEVDVEQADRSTLVSIIDYLRRLVGSAPTADFTESMESTKCIANTSDWGYDTSRERCSTVPDPAGANRQVLKMDFPEFSTTAGRAQDFLGGSWRYWFEDFAGYRPEMAHYRIGLYVPNGFEFVDDPIAYGGTKLCGLSTQYDEEREYLCGSGGDMCTEGEGFSARLCLCRPGHDLDGPGTSAPLFQYVYDADAADAGNKWGWHHPFDAGADTGEWMWIDECVRLNTPGERDGEIHTWIKPEGEKRQKAHEKTDYRFRGEGYDYGIAAWHMISYFGGGWGSPTDQSLYWRDLEIWADSSPLL